MKTTLRTPPLTTLVLVPMALALAGTACDGPGGRDDGLEGRGEAPPGQAPDREALIEAVRERMADQGIVPIPPAPPVPSQLYELGQSLAFDKLLSGNRNISCLTCHHPEVGSDDDRALSRGEGGVGLGTARQGGPIIPRNAPALFNLHTFDTMFWDSRVEFDRSGGLRTPAGDHLTAEMEEVFDFGLVSAQAMFPVTSREEMRGLEGDNELANVADGDFTSIWAALMARLGGVPEYVEMFESAYPGTRFEDMSFAHAANAIAGFELVAFESRDSPWERFVSGDDDALTDDELAGARLFFDHCARCHSGSAFSDFRHHNTGLAQVGPGKGHGELGNDDFGREGVTGNPDDRHAFRTTPLFNVELTAPYGHAGQFAELRDHIAHYVDPVGSLRDYDVTEHVDDEALWPLVLDNIDEVLETLSPRTAARFGGPGGGPRGMGGPPGGPGAAPPGQLGDPIAPQDAVTSIERFLGSLTADAATDLSDLVPARVPSGLPVAD